MKKVLFFPLFLVFLGTVCMNAQVTIGDSSAPHPGAVLDLKSAKGLKLPVVDILDVTVFQLSADLLTEATGMMVYNTNNATTGGQGKGIYIWDGGKWAFMAITMPVASVTVTAEDGTSPTSLVAGSTLQLVATVLPDGVLNKSVTWSRTSGTAANVTNWGLVTGTAIGTVVIRATSVADGSKWAEIALQIIPDPGKAGSVTGRNGTYTTWCWDSAIGTPGNMCWMTQNSMEGTSMATSYGEGAHTDWGYYYSLSQTAAAASEQACPPGWAVPDPSQWTLLKNYWLTGDATNFKNSWLTQGSGMTGCFDPSLPGWKSAGLVGYFRDNFLQVHTYQLTIWAGPAVTNVYASVRCVKSN